MDDNLKSLTQIKRSNGKIWTKKNDKNRFLFPNEYGAFEDKLKDKQKFSVKFLINTGARVNEAIHVKVGDCDLENKRIILRVTKSKTKKGEVKGFGRPRTIPISSQFAKYLKHELKDKKLDEPIGILSNPALNIAYKIAGRKADIKNYGDISSHTFRKTLEVWLMALGVDSLALTAHIGHDIKTAAQYYVSPDIFSWEEKKQMRLIIGDLYEGRRN